MAKTLKKRDRQFDDKLKEKVDKKIEKDDWLRVNMIFEVLAKTEQAAKESLEKHMKSLADQKQVSVYKMEFSELVRIENPLPKRPEITEAYSNIVEVEFGVQRYEDLISIVMHYGPSSTEILEPKHLKLTLGEAQGVLNSVADLVHKFVAAGIGGIVMKT